MVSAPAFHASRPRIHAALRPPSSGPDASWRYSGHVIFRLLLMAALSMGWLSAAEVLPLAGVWGFRLDPANAGHAGRWFEQTLGPDTIALPGSTDQAGYGTKVITPDKGFLTRPYRYEGPAWYQREVSIPSSWRGRRITLLLERVHYQTEVWVDGRPFGRQNSLSAPHQYDLTAALTPGRHRLTICVDNTYRIEVGRDASSMTDHTQTNWNGIVGAIELDASPPVWIDGVRTYPDIRALRLRVTGEIHSIGGRPPAGVLRAGVEGFPNGQVSARVAGSFDIAVPLAGAKLWDDHDPTIYQLTLRLGEDTVQVPFGLRQISTRGTQFLLNGRPIFLRGTLECNIFPLTGYPSTKEQDWERIFRIARSYGLNAFRFHSNCPPEAAFAAADRVGFLLHVELPVWSHVAGKDPVLDDYMRAEGFRILKAYGNHPSFTMLCLGNELVGDDGFLDGLVAEFKAADPRRLYTFSADHRRRAPGATSDYYVTQQTSAGRLRISGTRFGRAEDGTDHDFSASVKAVPVPLVAHELGQWAVYPSFDEIAKYTGVLKARNLEVFRDRLAARGMLGEARDFQYASGRFAWSIYKEDIEAALRTPGLGGYFLLQLEDFPGQGEALVGLLDSFWDSKGILTPEEFRRFSSDTVPLARMQKFVWREGETFEAAAEVAHYGSRPIDGAAARWRMTDDAGRLLRSGEFPPSDIPMGSLTALGAIRAPLAGIAGHLTLTIELPGTPARNDWSLWVYADAVDTEAPAGVTVATTWDAARTALAEGRRVLLHSVAGPALEANRFLPIFWSKAWGGPSFTGQPSHLGILCDPRHPALAQFPTARYEDFQWWELTENSRIFVLNDTPADFRPIVQVIDDFHRNYKLGAVFEAAVGPGKLLATCFDLSNHLDQRPVARQMLHSLLAYSAHFTPTAQLSPGQVETILNGK